MPQQPTDLESRLAASLQARSVADARVLCDLEAMQARLADGVALPELCAELQDVLSRVSTADAGASRLQQQWIDAQQTPGPELRHELDRQQQLLESLLACVHDLAALASADRDRLRPELDAAARARRMCAAYAAAGRMQ